MAKFLVGFEGRWQGEFAELHDALFWGREVSETGRLVHVVRRRLLGSKLIAVFPEEQAAEGQRLWKIRGAGAGYGGGKIW